MVVMVRTGKAWHQFGFTLMEILMVLAILSMLAVYTQADLYGRLKRERLELVKNDMHSLREMALNYYAQHRLWPESLTQLDDWLQDVTMNHKSPLGFDYQLIANSVGSSSETISRLQIITRTPDALSARDLHQLMGVWAVAGQTSLSMSVLPPANLLADNSGPYTLGGHINMAKGSIRDLGHIRLHNDGAGSTLIVDRLFVNNFVTDKLYAKKHTRNYIFGPFIKSHLGAFPNPSRPIGYAQY
jgi:prepilin-type N-terminal cleavage/methylation domain-containing protein